MEPFGTDVTGSPAAQQEFGRDVTPEWMRQQNIQNNERDQQWQLQQAEQRMQQAQRQAQMAQLMQRLFSALPQGQPDNMHQSIIRSIY